MIHIPPPIAAPAMAPQEQIVLSARQLDEQDRSYRREAAALATARLTRMEAAQGAGRAAGDGGGGRWTVVTEAELVHRTRSFGGVFRDRTSYSVRISVDYDGDGDADVAELVENRRRAGIRVTFGGATPSPSAIVFSMKGRWAQEQLLPAGRRRIYLAKPELGYTLIVRRNGSDLALHVGS